MSLWSRYVCPGPVAREQRDAVGAQLGEGIFDLCELSRRDAPRVLEKWLSSASVHVGVHEPDESLLPFSNA
jgi:hypothetical protein